MDKYKIELKWAFFYIAASLLWMFIEKLSGLHSVHIDKQQYLTLVFLIPAIWIYWLAMKDKKKNYYQNIISYKQAVMSGILMSLIVMIFAPLTQWVISTVITPEYFPNVIEYALATKYFATREEAEAYFSLNNYIIQSTIGAIIMGVVISAVMAFFIKSR